MGERFSIKRKKSYLGEKFDVSWIARLFTIDRDFATHFEPWNAENRSKRGDQIIQRWMAPSFTLSFFLSVTNKRIHSTLLTGHMHWEKSSHIVHRDWVMLEWHRRSYARRRTGRETSTWSTDIHRSEYVWPDIRRRMRQLENQCDHEDHITAVKLSIVLGGWWEVCSAMKVTLSSDAQGTGPSLAKFV